MKETESKNTIIEMLSRYGDPIILCSFGKDSMVTLHLLKSIFPNLGIPIIHWREASQHQKYDFADYIIRKWNLKVYDFPPMFNDIVYREGNFDGLAGRQIGNAWIYNPVEIHKPNGIWGCAIKDIMMRPTCQGFDYKWDLTFSGHKASDKDSILGNVPFNDLTTTVGPTTMFFPLKDWTDADIWEYIVKNDVPYDRKRYDSENGFKEFEDKTFNDNFHFACADCLDPRLPEMVFCRETGKEVENVGPKIDYTKKLQEYKSAMKYIDWEAQNG